MVRHGSRAACGTLVAAALIVVLVPALAAAEPAEAQHGSGPVLNARGPAPSPDGSAIAFSYMGDIWRVSADGGQAERLTVHEAYDESPLWSPDGTRIAFTSDREGNEDVYVMPAAGGVPTRLTTHSGWDDAQCWTRDGDDDPPHLVSRTRSRRSSAWSRRRVGFPAA